MCLAPMLWLWGALSFGVEATAPATSGAPSGGSSGYAPLAIRLDNKFYNRPNGFRVKDGRLSFMHLEGTASLPVEGLGAKDLLQFPAALREQIAAEVVAVARRREEQARQEQEMAKTGARAHRGGKFPGPLGGLAGPNGSLRFIPVEPEGGGAVAVEKVTPKAGGALDGRTADGGGDFGTVPQPSREVRSAVESHGRVARLIASNDIAGATVELDAMVGLNAVSRADGEYIDATVLDASFKIFDVAIRSDDEVAGTRSLGAASSVGGNRPEVVKLLQGAFERVCIMADGAEFDAVRRWVETLEIAGPAYGIVLEMGRQRVARRVLKSALAELRGFNFRKAWDGYSLSKGLWVQNPDLGPIGLAVGLGGAVAIGLMTFFVWKLVDGLRALSGGRGSSSGGRGGHRTEGGAFQRRPTSGPRPLPRQRPDA